MAAPLARDQHGDSFELPPEAVSWRVRRHTGGRPSTVLGLDGEPLFVPIHCDKADLRSNGCSGSIRLEAVDESRKAVEAPVAYVELGDAEERRPGLASDGMHADLVRVSFEAMTRTMEAMQRAQVERERTLAQKERALADAQVASQRTNVELMIALVERLGGGKPQDPIAILKQQLQFQRALDEGVQRNAGLLPAVSTVERPQPATWIDAVKPLAPIAAEVIANAFAKDDPEKADQIRQNLSMFARAFSGAATGAAPAIELSGRNAERDVRPIVPRPIREVMALLDDAEAARFSDFLDQLSDADYERACRESACVEPLDARLVWARGLIQSNSAAAPTATLAVPPALVPVLQRLSPAELEAGGQLVASLDLATLSSLAERLQAMPVEEAVAALRKIIAEARRRAASVAHRAVATTLGGNAPISTGGGAS